MEFHVPHTDSDEQSEQVWIRVRAFLTQQGFSTTERRIRKVYFHHNGKDYEAEIGKVFSDLQEEALLILEGCQP